MCDSGRCELCGPGRVRAPAVGPVRPSRSCGERGQAPHLVHAVVAALPAQHRRLSARAGSRMSRGPQESWVNWRCRRTPSLWAQHCNSCGGAASTSMSEAMGGGAPCRAGRLPSRTEPETGPRDGVGRGAVLTRGASGPLSARDTDRPGTRAGTCPRSADAHAPSAGHLVFSLRTDWRITSWVLKTTWSSPVMRSPRSSASRTAVRPRSS